MLLFFNAWQQVNVARKVMDFAYRYFLFAQMGRAFRGKVGLNMRFRQGREWRGYNNELQRIER